ncbi:MAG: TIGR00159 family protein [Bdellovibrionales bacterium]|nr:TIGR00159 family protein [Bdellovibrionales bacterium]
MFQQFIDNLVFIVSHLRIQDLIDMILVWMVVYRILVLIKRTGTIQMLSGLGVLAIGYILSIWLELFTFNWLLEKFFSNLFVIVVILFQGEIRRALAHIGSNPFFTDVSAAQETHVIEEIAKGIIAAAQKGYGALVVIEREIVIDYHIEFGTEIDAKVSAELITSIFHPTSPMHDGALLIRGGKIHSAGCFLPLSKNPALDKNLGTRHRAAIGLTEETDALVFVVSEENKSIGIVQGGHLTANAELGDIRKALYETYGLKYKAFQQGEASL